MFKFVIVIITRCELLIGLNVLNEFVMNRLINRLMNWGLVRMLWRGAWFTTISD